MQSFTKKEIEWIAREIADAAERLKQVRGTAETQLERSLCTLRAEQFQIIAEKLSAVVANGDKRIAIR